MAAGGFPGLKTQKTKIKSLLNVKLKKGDTWYLIDMKWFKQWKKYVGYDTWDSGSVGEESANPGPIDNKNLFKENTLVEGQTPKLKGHMTDNKDYILVPEKAWNKLIAWYGLTEGQEPIARKVIELGTSVRDCKVDVYQCYLDLKLCENSHPKNQTTRQFCRTDTIDDLEKEMRRTFNIAENKEVRLWHRYTKNNYEHLNKPEDTLQDAGLDQGQVIVIVLKNEDGTWPRQAKSTSSYNTSGPQRSGNSYSSSSSSYDSGYSGYEGRVSRHGQCGLSNLGNTCFMNSAIQCMSNVPPLTQYFLGEDWVNAINQENPFGMHGEIAMAYAGLIQVMWSGKHSYTVPRNFKSAVGQFAPQFSGYHQHDCQELMAFLLDGLHEDLNKIQKKPYVEMKDADGRPDKVVADEAWDNYKQRNDSIIVDIFHGLYKFTVDCLGCSNKSVTFDPFCYLSLPLPVKKERQIDVFWVPLNPSEKSVQFKLTVPKMGCVADMCNVLAEYVEVKPEYMVVTDVCRYIFRKVFSKDESLSHMMERDDRCIFIYQVPVKSADDPDLLIIPIYLREQSSRSKKQQYQLFGQPLLLTVPGNCSYDQLYSLVLQRLQRCVHVPPEADKWWIEEKTATTSKHEEKEVESQATIVNGSGSEENIDGKGNSSYSVEEKIEEETYTQDKPSTSDMGMEVSNGEDSSNKVTDEKKFSNDINGSNQTSENSEDCVRTDNSKLPRLFKFTLVDPYGKNASVDCKLKDDGKPLKLNSQSYVAVDWNPVARKRFYSEGAAKDITQHETMKLKPLKKQVIQINDCLELLTKNEKLGKKDPWYCPKCGKPQQATKKFDIWSLPDVLIIHLKRFFYDRNLREKIDTLVEFPTRGLDMKKYVIGDKSGPLLYDLIAVANHFGGLGGGHYTAYGKNCEDGKWYNFNDSSVSEATEESSVTKAAYVLVYMNQNPQPHLTKPNSMATAPNPETTMDRQNGPRVEEEMDTNYNLIYSRQKPSNISTVSSLRR